MALAGRSEARLAEVGRELDAPTFSFDARDFESCEHGVTGAADRLGGLDVRPQHMETGFSDRALAGERPGLPEPLDPNRVGATVLQALRDEKREVAFDLKARALVVG